MEELYLQQGLESMVNTISSSIAGRLESLGIKTAKHVRDYLDDKYKRDYEITRPNYNLQNAVSGDILGNNHLSIDEIIKKHPIKERTPDEIQYLEEVLKKYDVEREINRQAAKLRKIALNDDDHLAKKEYERVTTDMPDPHRGVSYNAWNMYVIPEEKRSLNTAEGILKLLKDYHPKTIKIKL